MIHRGGVVASGQKHNQSPFFKKRTSRAHVLPFEMVQHARRPLRPGTIAISVAAVALILAVLPKRTAITPLVESDYCYLLTAADRFYDGQGLTATPPVAPHQPWSWQKDWTFLTRWPIGYPLLVWTLRSSFDFSTIQACRWISVAACALSLVGWFVLIKRTVPDGIAGILLAAIAAGCSVSTASFINPSTDAVVMAVFPWILLWITTSLPVMDTTETDRPSRNIALRLGMIGFVSGMLLWIRYAAIFIPMGICAYLLFSWCKHRSIRFRDWFFFTGFAAIPVAILMAINRTLGSTGSIQSQLNLGTAVNPDVSPSMLTTVWWNFTEFGFYDYHRFSHWFYAVWPAVILSAGLLIRPLRNSFRTYMKTPGMGMSVFLVAALLTLLLAATALFGDKYNYVGLDRYYLPVKPLYFLLFVSPLLLIPRRFVRLVLCIVLIAGCHWLISVEWSRPYQRRLAASRPATAYGQWSRCFEPGADTVYTWLKEQAGSHLIVVSNFHEYVVLETKIPALPVPPDAPTLNQWVERICETRGITDPRILFVLDPDNQWRDYWIPDPDEIIQTFDLKDRIRLSENPSTLIFSYPSSTIMNSETAHIALK